MPSKTPAQAAFMRAISHSPEFAKKVGVPQKVGAEFESADEAKSTRSKMKKRYAKAAK